MPKESGFGFVEKPEPKKEIPSERALTEIGKPVDFPIERMAETLVGALAADRGRLREIEAGVHNRLFRALKGGAAVKKLEMKSAMGLIAANPKFSGRVTAAEIARIVDAMWEGHEGMEKAVKTLETTFVKQRPESRQFIGLNDFIDAKFAVDAVEIAHAADGIERVRLVQVKSKSIGAAEAAAVARAHQEYVDSLVDAAGARQGEAVRALRQDRADFLSRLAGQEKVSGQLETLLGRYENFFLDLIQWSAKKIRPETSEEEIRSWAGNVPVAEIARRFTLESGPRAFTLFAELWQLGAEEAAAALQVVKDVCRWASGKRFSAEELFEQFPLTGIGEGRMTVKQVRSVVIVDGKVVSDKPLRVPASGVVLTSA